jgi:hypothetical protein
MISRYHNIKKLNLYIYAKELVSHATPVQLLNFIFSFSPFIYKK